MLITRPLSENQKKALENRDKPSENDQLKAIEDFINYAGLKLLELEEKADGKVYAIRPAVDYTC